MTGHPTNTSTNIVLEKKTTENKEPKQKEIVSLGSWNKSITIKDEFFTSAHELYDIFLNPDKVRAWTYVYLLFNFNYIYNIYNI